MDDKMADSQMLGDIAADAIESGHKSAIEGIADYIMEIRDWLKNLAEDRSIPMDVKLHTLLWDKIQTIDHDIGMGIKKVEK